MVAKILGVIARFTTNLIAKIQPESANLIPKFTMRHSRKHSIRTARIRDRLLYHKADIEACVIAQRQ
jgi:hypothetical protein